MAKRLLPRNPPRRVPPPVRETGIFDMEPQLTEKERRIVGRPPLINEREREHKKPLESEQTMKREELRTLARVAELHKKPWEIEQPMKREELRTLARVAELRKKNKGKK